ncbi:MAG: MetQ/NlpA family ABC transporter substrate-binding protein [Firmicutes bacterium]|nr:MetQ/NlpA family ABC transporter substrate-binding protein [Bacillota bacterium]
MKKFLALALAAVLTVGVAACSSGETTTETTETKETVKIKVGATPAPHAEILEAVKDTLLEEGIELEIVEFNDYVIPNTSTESGELDANYFQHQPYLTDFNAQNGTHLVSVASIHYEPFGIYGGKTKSLEELADGATIAVPNDGTNEARALMLLQAQGLITLKADAGFTATILDIESNPKNLDIKELEAAQLPRTLQDVDLAVINGNYAIEAGLNAGKDALAVEDANSEAAQTYANILVVKEGNENNEAVQALAKALMSETAKEFMNATYEGAVLPMF